jgi:RNA polymerase sigma factor (sigma-70 family)
LLHSDAELVRLARESAGEGDAGRQTANNCMAVLYARHRDLVRAVIAAKVPRDAVDDLESEVLVRFAVKFRSGDAITNPAGLLVRMARFVRADYHARRERGDDMPLEEWNAYADDPGLEKAEIGDAVEELLAPLNERQREVVCQRILENRPRAEVATMLGTTPGNVDVIFHRALAKLQETAR